MNLLYQFDLTIKNIDSQLSVFIDQSKNHHIKIFRQKESWGNTFDDAEELVDRLKMAVQNQYCMQLKIDMIDDESEIIIHIVHPAYKTSDKIQLLKCVQNDGMLESQLLKLTDVVKNVRKVYPIRRHMLGPKYIHYTLYSDINKTKQLIKDFLTKLDNYVQNPQNEQYMKDLFLMMSRIPNYYKITHIYQNTRPVPTDNQIIIDNIIMSFNNCSNPPKTNVQKSKNMFTVFTKKFQDPDIIGYMTVDHVHNDDVKRVDIHLPCTYVNVEARTDTNNIPLNKYFDSYYFLKLPAEMSIPPGMHVYEKCDKFMDKSAILALRDNGFHSGKTAYVEQNKLCLNFRHNLINNGIIDVSDHSLKDIFFGGTLIYD